MSESKAKRTDYVKVVIIGAVIALGILGLVIFGLWSLAKSISPDTVIWWAVIATLAIVPVFFFGFYLGKVEARGLLHGFDHSLDRLTGLVGDVVSTRDNSRIAVHKATSTPQPMYQVVLPNVQQIAPQITHRQIGDNDSTIDL